MSSAFSVVAIIAAFNEADIIGQVVRDLIDQGIHVYFMDDGSTDGTVAAVEPYLGRGVLAIERRAGAGGEALPAFEWERILKRKTELARELDASWFIHHDADEFRESPWSQLPLKDAIARVDALGFNAIDFTSLDFWPVHDTFRAGDDVRTAFPFYAERAPYDRIQIRCWKKAADLDLASSGGHDAQFSGRRVFPVRFILRHYPIRGQAHGERKVFEERKGRFSDLERARGWHVQYDEAREGASFIRDPSTLTPYDPDAVRLALMLRHRGVEALEASLEGARAEIQLERAEIERRGAELVRTRGEWEGKVAEAAALHRDLGLRMSELAGARAEAEARDAQIHAQNAAICARDVEIAARGHELDARGAALDAAAAHVAQLNDALAHRAADIERLQSTIVEQTRRLDELHHSLSWRWTTPLRALHRILRRR